jgi:Ca2+-binding EF-hand superfamily protein
MFSLAVMIWSIFNGRQGGPFLVHDAPPFNKIRQNTLALPLDVTRLPPGLSDSVAQMADKNFRSRPMAQEVLEGPFFKELAQHQNSLEPECIRALEVASEKQSLINLVACDIVDCENVSQLREINKLFAKLDPHSTGFVEIQDARRGLLACGLDSKRADCLTKALLGDCGRLRYSAFVAKVYAASRKLEADEMLRLFRSMDTDNNHFLDVEEVRAVLARPNISALMNGRSAEDVISQMDIDKNGVIDFEEFRKALQGDSKAVLSRTVGDIAEHKSENQGKPVDCRMTRVDTETGRVMIDIKPGTWLTDNAQKCLTRRDPAAEDSCKSENEGSVQKVQEAKAMQEVVKSLSKPTVVVHPPRTCRNPLTERNVVVTPRAKSQSVKRPETWVPGDFCIYRSERKNASFLGIITACADNAAAVMINLKPGYWMFPEEQARVLTRRDSGVSTLRSVFQPLSVTPSPSIRCTARTRSAATWVAGQACVYFSKRQTAQFRAKIVAVDADNGNVMIDIKEGYWLSPAEQAEVLLHC